MSLLSWVRIFFFWTVLAFDISMGMSANPPYQPSVSIANNFDSWKNQKLQQSKVIVNRLQVYQDETRLNTNRDIHHHGATFGFDIFLGNGRVASLDFDRMVFSSSDLSRSSAEMNYKQLEFEKKYNIMLIFAPDEEIFYNRDRALKAHTLISEKKISSFKNYRHYQLERNDYQLEKERVLEAAQRKKQTNDANEFFNAVENDKKILERDKILFQDLGYNVSKINDVLDFYDREHEKLLKNIVSFNKILFPFDKLNHFQNTNKASLDYVKDILGTKKDIELSLSAFFQEKITKGLTENKTKIIKKYGDWSHSEEVMRFFWNTQQDFLQKIIQSTLGKSGIRNEDIEGYQLNLYSLNDSCFSCHGSLSQELLDSKDGNYKFWHADLMGDRKFVSYALFYRHVYPVSARLYEQSDQAFQEHVSNVKIQSLYDKVTDFKGVSYPQLKTHALFVDLLSQTQNQILVSQKDICDARGYSKRLIKALNVFVSLPQISLENGFELIQHVARYPFLEEPKKDQIIKDLQLRLEKIVQLQHEQKCYEKVLKEDEILFKTLVEKTRSQKEDQEGEEIKKSPIEADLQDILKKRQQEGGAIKQSILISRKQFVDKVNNLIDKNIEELIKNMPQKELPFPFNIHIE